VDRDPGTQAAKTAVTQSLLGNPTSRAHNWARRPSHSVPALTSLETDSKGFQTSIGPQGTLSSTAPQCPGSGVTIAYWQQQTI
jgi:hypothetical protein